MSKVKSDDKNFYYYYLRYSNHNPYGCVCLATDTEGKWARGISICAVMDRFDKRTARRIAKRRCLHALFTRTNSECMSDLNHGVVADGMLVFRDVDNECKSTYAATLTKNEQAITECTGKDQFFDREAEIAKAHK